MTSRLGLHVLCEGYNDRDFIAEYLERSGWEAKRSTKSSPVFGNIATGRFLFAKAESGQELLLTQCGGVSKIVPLAVSLLRLRETKPLALLLVDDEDDEFDTPGVPTGPTALRRLIELADTLKEQRPTSCETELFGVRCASVSWRSDLQSEGLPSQQTLERMVAAAFAERDEDAASGVEKWLKHDPPPGESGPKAYAHSYFAKWLARTNSDFYRAVWREKSLEPLLRRGIEACGFAERLRYLEQAHEPSDPAHAP